MAKIATTKDNTVWECDACGTTATSPTAFDIPPGWWVVDAERRTERDGEYGYKLKRGRIDACSKACVISAIQYQATELIEYVETT